MPSAAVLAQKYDSGERPVAFLSKSLDTCLTQLLNVGKRTLRDCLVCPRTPSLSPYQPLHSSVLTTSPPYRSLTLPMSNSLLSPVAVFFVGSLSCNPIPSLPNTPLANPMSLLTLLVVSPSTPAWLLLTWNLRHSANKPFSLTPPPHSSLSSIVPITTPLTSKIFFQQLSNNYYHPRYALLDKLIVSRETPHRVFVPDDVELRKSIFQEAHDTPLAGHPGFHRMNNYIRQHFFGPRLRIDVLDYVRSCPQCQIAKPRHTRPFGALMPLQPPEAPWQDISLDLITQLPAPTSSIPSSSSSIAFPKWHTSSPPPRQRTHLLLRACSKKVLSVYMVSRVRLSVIVTRAFCPHSGVNFLSSLEQPCVFPQPITLKRMARQNAQIAHLNNTYAFSPATHQQHGIHSFRSQNCPTTAPLILPQDTAPFYLVYNHHPNFPLDLLRGPVEGRNDAIESLFNNHYTVHQRARDALQQAIDNMVKQSKDGSPAPFQSGDLVLVHRVAFRKNADLADLKKFDDRWFGPFEDYQSRQPKCIINSNSPPTSNITMSSMSHFYIHIVSLSVFPRPHPDSVRPAAEPDASLDVADDPDAEQYEVESILQYCLAIPNKRKSSERLSVAEQLRISKKLMDFEFLIK